MKITQFVGIVALLVFSLHVLLPSTCAQTKEFQETKLKAEKGDTQAQYDLGIMFSKGPGVYHDLGEAAKWFRKAAEQNSNFPQRKLAQHNLAVLYENGWGVQKDYAEAAKWYRKAADQAFVPAQVMLGVLYREGHGVERDYAEAVKWFRKAAGKGDVLGQKNLAAAYSAGQGIEKDYLEAYAWFNLSAANGSEDAGKYRDELEKRMSVAQVADAQKRTKELKKIIDDNQDGGFAPLSRPGSSSSLPSVSTLPSFDPSKPFPDVTSSSPSPLAAPLLRPSTDSVVRSLVRPRESKIYLSSGSGHWIRSKSDDGDIITLEDGSVWLVDPLDRIDTSIWLPISEITVIESNGAYLLINTDDGEKAHATLVHQ